MVGNLAMSTVEMYTLSQIRIENVLRFFYKAEKDFLVCLMWWYVINYMTALTLCNVCYIGTFVNQPGKDVLSVEYVNMYYASSAWTREK